MFKKQLIIALALLLPGLALGAHQSTEEVVLPFTFEMCGVGYDSVWINSSGNLTFGEGDLNSTESMFDMRSGPPRIAGLFDDLDPTAGGSIETSETKKTFSVHFIDVPEFSSGGANSFTITLKNNSNHVGVVYGDMSAEDGLAGVSCGGKVSSLVEPEFDLGSHAGSVINLQNSTVMAEQFTPFGTGTIGGPGGDVNDLSGVTLQYSGTKAHHDEWAEPNDTSKKARHVNLPFNSSPINHLTEIAWGGDDVDYYRFKGNEGEKLIAQITASTNLDTFMCLFAPDGALLESDDDDGIGLRSEIIHDLPEDGFYRIALTTFPDTDCDGEGGGSAEGRYVLDMFTTMGDVLALGSFNSTVELELDFDFSFQGMDYDSVFVNSNGNLTFGAGDLDEIDSVVDFLAGDPRIAPFWDFFNTGLGGVIVAEGDSSHMTVKYSGVTEGFYTGPSTFSATLFADGSIKLEYEGISANQGTVGITEGDGASDPGATDLSEAGIMSKSGTTYERFEFGDDLSNSTLEFE